MSYIANKLIKLAQAEIGYKEKETNSQLDSKTANAGDENYTKYARDLYNAGYYNGNKNGYDWCEVFVDWLFYQLCGKDAKKAQELISQTGPYGAGCTQSYGYYKAKGRIYSSPCVGDQIYFGSSANAVYHTGIVESVADGYITTIEGNYNEQVARCRYKIGYSSILGYGRPNYDAETAAAPAKAETATSATTYTVCKGDAMWKIAEKYGVSTSALINANPQIENPSLIYAGHKINIPGSAKAPAKPTTYTVQRGDSMWAIAEKLGVDYQALLNANPQVENKSLIYAGQKINIPR